jgi:hypothetical protein
MNLFGVLNKVSKILATLESLPYMPVSWRGVEQPGSSSGS